MTLGPIPFLDAARAALPRPRSEPNSETVEEPGGFLEVKPVIFRPWTAYWPPQADSELFKWLLDALPEAITWRWDPRTPFDRPWQRWLKQGPCERPLLGETSKARGALAANTKPRIIHPVYEGANSSYCMT